VHSSLKLISTLLFTALSSLGGRGRLKIKKQMTISRKAGGGCSSSVPPPGGFFSADRFAKYGWGAPRLALVAYLAFEAAPAWSSHFCCSSPAVTASARACGAVLEHGGVASLGLRAYATSGRWLAHLFVGAQGAVVNIEVSSEYLECRVRYMLA